MKKIITIIMSLALMVTLAGCKPKVEDVELDILIPRGVAEMTQAYMQYSTPNIGDNVGYIVETVTDMSLIETAFNNETYEIIYAPINQGAKWYNDEGNYELVAMISTGSFHLVSGSSEELSLETLAGKEIYAYEENTTPGIVLEILLSRVEYETEPTITYLDSIYDVMDQLENDEDSIVLLEYPFMHDAINGIEYSRLSLNDIWSDEIGIDIPHYGIFAHKDVEVEVVESYVREVKLSIIELQDHPVDVIDMLETVRDEEYQINWAGTVDSCGIRFVEPDNAKQLIVAYFELVFVLDSTLIGSKYPTRAFYQ